MPLTTEELQDPARLEESIWRLLARGSVDSKHPFKLFSVATVSNIGLPDTRMVVLRACDIIAKELCFHTDIRSGKVEHLKQQPELCLLFWHPKQSLQLRVYGAAQVHHLDETTAEKIMALPPQQIALYGFAAQPGTKLEQNNEPVFDSHLVAQNFAWVRVPVHTIDLLHLGRSGVHTRVRFDYNEASLQDAIYLKP